MRIQVMQAIGLLLLSLSCLGCPSRGWPEKELQALNQECDTAPMDTPETADLERATCHCLYRILPERISWERFSQYRAQNRATGISTDKQATEILVQASAECAVQTMQQRANRP